MDRCNNIIELNGKELDCVTTDGGSNLVNGGKFAGFALGFGLGFAGGCVRLFVTLLEEGYYYKGHSILGLKNVPISPVLLSKLFWNKAPYMLFYPTIAALLTGFVTSSIENILRKITD